MERVTGIGGIFITSAQPERLRAWYREHLGMDIQAWGGMSFPWHSAERPTPDGATIWTVFEAGTDYLAPSTAPFMVNYRVHDLYALLAALRSEGCQVVGEPQASEYGKFGWVLDPDGNKIELWEPPAGAVPG
jgi:catechol 2,3-dioxygenase-like lactoylglutathione lyase family enzyme